jgi:hypothetical protein
VAWYLTKRNHYKIYKFKENNGSKIIFKIFFHIHTDYQSGRFNFMFPLEIDFRENLPAA